MEFRTLRYFAAVAEEQNMSRAAQLLRLSQPALSRQIKALEQEVGAALFLRHANAVSLTPEGQLLLSKARDIVRRADAAVAAVRKAVGNSVVRVAYSSSLAASLIAGAMRHMARAHPAARVELIDLSSTDMHRGLFRGSIDVIVTIGSGLDRGIRWVRLQQVGVSALLPQSHPLAKGRVVALSELASEPWVIFSRKDYPEFWQKIRPWLHKHRIRPRIAGEFDGINTLATAVAAGVGIGLVNTLFKPAKGFVSRPITPPPNPSWVAAGTYGRARKNPHIEIFLQSIVQTSPLNKF